LAHVLFGEPGLHFAATWASREGLNVKIIKFVGLTLAGLLILAGLVL
jgi:hypothetical protein